MPDTITLKQVLSVQEMQLGQFYLWKGSVYFPYSRNNKKFIGTSRKYVLAIVVGKLLRGGLGTDSLSITTFSENDFEDYPDTHGFFEFSSFPSADKFRQRLKDYGEIFYEPARQLIN